eukprot:COSAG06_NODE_11_length_35482_cov_68.929888_9_plen_442_part_00
MPDARSAECWKRMYGRPGFASDIFSFGMMLWEMFARRGLRIYEAFNSIDPELHYVVNAATGKKSANVQLVPARLAEDNERPARLADCPELLYTLMQSCWVHSVDQPNFGRPAAVEVSVALHKMQQMAHALAPPAETPPCTSLSFGDFLRKLGIEDKRDALADWDVREQLKENGEIGPLEKLQAMLQDEKDEAGEDFADMITDVFDGNDEAQSSFRAEVKQLQDSSLQADAESKPGAAWAKILQKLELDSVALAKKVKRQEETQMRKAHQSNLEKQKVAQEEERKVKSQKRRTHRKLRDSLEFSSDSEEEFEKEPPWSAARLAARLESCIRLKKPMPLRMWLMFDVTIEGEAIGSLEPDWGDVLCEAADGDIDIWDFAANVNGDALEAAIKKSGKKAPVFKKLLLRLHYELQFLLTESQAKKIKVTPHGPPEGVPGGGGAAK